MTTSLWLSRECWHGDGATDALSPTILPKFCNVPSGLGVSSGGSYSSFESDIAQTQAAVLMDGVPATVPLRDGGRDLMLISLGAIGCVEVIRGATAL